MIGSQLIKEKARTLGLDVRICLTKPFFDVAEQIKKQREKNLFLNNAWNDAEIDDFCNPCSILPQAKSIISSYLFYLNPEEPDPSQDGKPFGLVARYTHRNYYKELKKRLKNLADFLGKEYRAKFIVHSCGPIAEKPIAQRSGTGYYGKHSIIINPDYGSYIVLGEIVTDLEIEPDEPLKMGCGNCSMCMDVCPTKAIIAPYIIDRKRCIQDLTNWEGLIPDDIARVWLNRIYGCTTCQEACPINKKVKPEMPKTDIGVVGAYLSLLDVLQMDEQTYRKKYSDNQITARWIHFDAIKRNALLALAYFRDKKTIPIIERFAKGHNQLLRDTAIWTLRQF